MALLSQLQPGDEATILALHGDGRLVERMRELGFVEGEKVFLAQRLWGADGHIVHIQNASVALRREEANCMEVDAIHHREKIS